MLAELTLPFFACSNRSAALLKLNKVQKALVDAEECIKCKPDWEKGYFRKGNVLEATQKYDQVEIFLWRCLMISSASTGAPVTQGDIRLPLQIYVLSA